MKFYIAILFFMLAPAIQLFAQKPPMLDSYRAYRQSLKGHPEKQMLELKKVVPGIAYDLRYATTDNFMKRRMYPAGTTRAFLRKGAAMALAAVQHELKGKNLGLKIFDAYRPWSVSKSFWDLVQDERYVANPARGSNHNRGIAVDLTIINLKTGTELNMGTGFDNFTDTAHHSFTNLPPAFMANRQLLKDVMEKYGFAAYDEEWWHYTFKSNVQFEVLDVPFKKLGRQ